MDKMTFIYALVCPDSGEVKYVGKSDDPQRRFKEHVGLYDVFCTPKTDWIRSLLNNGKLPVLMILEEVPFVEWENAETRWIAHYRLINPDLTNSYIGRRGNKRLGQPKPCGEIMGGNPKTGIILDYFGLGVFVASYRKSIGISQYDFAKKVGISRNYLVIIEQGVVQNLSVDILVRLAFAMKENPCNLLNVLLATSPGEAYRAVHPERKGKDV